MKTITDNAAQLLYDGRPRLANFGLPLAAGVLRSPEALKLTLGNQALEAHIEARSFWPDGSVRWCWCQTIVTQSGLLGLHIQQDLEVPDAEQVTRKPDNVDSSPVTPAHAVDSDHDEAQCTDTQISKAAPNKLGAHATRKPILGSPILPTWTQSRVSGQTLLCFIPIQSQLSHSSQTVATKAPAENTNTLDSKHKIDGNSGSASAIDITKLSLQVQLTLAGQTQPMALSQLRAQHSQNSLSETVLFTGELHQTKQSQTRQTLHLTAKFIRTIKTNEFTFSLRLHNPNAARHSTGSWDLGDAGSCIIDKFALVFSCPDTVPGLHLESLSLAEKAQEIPAITQHVVNGDFTLTQHGSGGQHWQSPIHVDAQGRHPVKARGFTLQTAATTNTTNNAKAAPSEGLRAQPTGTLLTIRNSPDTNAEAVPHSALAIHISLKDFWQNFPTQLIGTRGGLRFELFPHTTELQGGESKTWHFSGQLFNRTDAEPSIEKLTPPRLRYNHAYLNNSGVFPHVRFSQTVNPISELIFRGLTGDTNFFQKREATDVYGWRHYGELYADHEAVNSKPDSYFISHYNNQYDPLMGMTLQYLHWGELSWLDLIGPLAQHIKDIDIYDTVEDKAEYNGGLFWHTDHYLPAETSTHRSYSRHHTAAYEGYAGGGGPGGQHCYTTGLALQYWLFGDEQAKEKVLQLTSWIRAFYNGSGSLLDRTFRLLTIDFKKRQLTNIGLKVPGFRYPLDRGTGNYLIALLDAFELTQTDTFMQEMGDVIRQTVHPTDDIAARNLKDVENAWFYTVFLQALCRYLCLKESLQNIDDDYWYARHCFVHYLQWMLTNESFYLDDPDQLEFPNDTWCAQEMRKANLFCFGWYFAQNAEPEYLTRAEQFYHYIEKKLAQSPEAEFTRVLALLMQNDGVRQKFRSRPRSEVRWVEKTYPPHPGFDAKRILATFFKDILKLLSQFSPKRELHWIKLRFPKLFR